nr:hypothetical protein [Tanacetum cinerariifolium]
MFLGIINRHVASEHDHITKEYGFQEMVDDVAVIEEVYANIAQNMPAALDEFKILSNPPAHVYSMITLITDDDQAHTVGLDVSNLIAT